MDTFPKSDVKVFWGQACEISGGNHKTVAAVTLALVLMNGFREIADALEKVAESNHAVANTIDYKPLGEKS